MILALAMRYMIGVAAVFLVCTMFFPGQIMSLLTNEPALIERGALYLRIAGISYVPLGLSQMYICIMKNSGKTAKSTVIGSSSMLLNLGFNVVFIFGFLGVPAMGIQGATIATVLATSIQFIWTLVEAGKPDSTKIRPSCFIQMNKKSGRILIAMLY